MPSKPDHEALVLNLAAGTAMLSAAEIPAQKQGQTGDKITTRAFAGDAPAKFDFARTGRRACSTCASVPCCPASLPPSAIVGATTRCRFAGGTDGTALAGGLRTKGTTTATISSSASGRVRALRRFRNSGMSSSRILAGRAGKKKRRRTAGGGTKSGLSKWDRLISPC